MTNYVKTEWSNEVAPPINAENLNKIEQGVFDAYDSYATADEIRALPVPIFSNLKVELYGTQSGIYVADLSDTSTPEDTTSNAAGLVIVSTAGVRYKRDDSCEICVDIFGAGEGGDDTQAFKDALLSGASVIYGNPIKRYNINETLVIGDKVLDMRGATISATGGNKVFTVASGSLLNAEILGNDLDHGSSIGSILEGDGARVMGVKIKNFHGQASFQTYCIEVPLFGAYNFYIDDILFKNITQDDNGAVVGQGFVGGLRFYSGTLGTQETTSSGRVKNLTGNHIYSVDTGAGVVQDSDLIRLYWDVANGNISDLDWNIDFENITGINVGKRIFKTGGINGCTAKNIKCFKYDGLHEDMYGSVVLTAGSSRWNIDGVTGSGAISRGVVLNGSDNVVSNIDVSSTAAGATYCLQVGGTSGQATNNVINSLVSSGFNATAYIYDGVDNVINGLVSKGCSIAFFNNPASIGNTGNIVNNLESRGGLVRVSSGSFSLNNVSIKDTPLTALGHAFEINGGSAKVRGLSVDATQSARRPVNIALAADGYLDIDDVIITRSSSAGAIVNDHCIFTTQDSAVGSKLKIGTMSVIANSNPSTGGSNAEGRQLVLIKNVNYEINKLHVTNNAAIGSNSSDVAVINAQGACSFGTLKTTQNIAGSSVSINNSTNGTTIEVLDIENGFNNNIACYIGTALKRGGCSIANELNTVNEITVV